MIIITLKAMISIEGESVEFNKPVRADSKEGVEKWLQEVKNTMVATLQKKIHIACKELASNQVERKVWVLNHCG